MKTIIPDIIISSLQVTNKKQVFHKMAHKVSSVFDIDADHLILSLLDRERIGSTSIGNGVAIPHAQISGIDRFMSVFCVLDNPISFDSFDGKDVDLVYLLLAPENVEGNEHLRALAKASRFFRDPEICAELRKAFVDPEDDMNLLAPKTVFREMSA